MSISLRRRVLWPRSVLFFGCAVLLMGGMGSGQALATESAAAFGNTAAPGAMAAWPALLTAGDDLCSWERELDALLGDSGTSVVAERPSCEERLARFSNKVSASQTEAAPGLRLQVAALVADSPMEVMTQAIVHYDPEIAGLIVGIGKKESDWGRRTPKLAGEECYNFWGYRGPGDRGLTPDGYGCWATPEAAVRAIGDRLGELRKLRASSAPERMVVWKCGSSCAAHSPESVRKWIADVDLYYREIARR